jgi:hypothetical protein
MLKVNVLNFSTKLEMTDKITFHRAYFLFLNMLLITIEWGNVTAAINEKKTA